jgi:N-acetylmuramoyl-L-alanine amidase
MYTEIKNGKLPTFNIYILPIVFLLVVPVRISSHPAHPKTNGKWVIVLDPGHGGRDPGALGSFSQEKSINLAIALKTGKYLTDSLSNVKVIYTRDDDTNPDLYERPKIANRNNADLFISIHSNSAPSRSVSGAETYIMGNAKTEANLAVAMKENEVIMKEEDYSTKYEGFNPKSTESYIIFTLTQNLYRKQSTELASFLQTQIADRVNRNNRGVQESGFWVLWSTSMPSVLIETGFITNPTDEKYLNSEAGQNYLALAIYKACRQYIEGIDSKSNISTVKPDSAKTSQNKNDKELYFTVQVKSSATKSEIKPENFKGISDIFEIATESRYRYVTGRFREYADAVKYRKQVESIYPDAFVIAVRENKIVPLRQALDQKGKK